jgi:hypothetical protein
VLCLSLGGTKVQMGVLDADGGFVTDPEIYWRSALPYETPTTDFAIWLVAEMSRFLRARGREWQDIDVVGVPFPGPQLDAHWYSNNLPQEFVDGTRFDSILAQAIAQQTQVDVDVAVAYDAQCDAAGELLHPDGRLMTVGGDATVINIATGIAAGFVADGELLRTRVDYQQIHASFDLTMGQLGRHLWWDEDAHAWTYYPHGLGELPDSERRVSRLTDRLGGPGLAARLLRTLRGAGLVNATAADADERLERAQLASEIEGLSVAEGAYQMRRQPGTVVRTLLQWLDRAYLRRAGGATDSAAVLAEDFIEAVAAELGAAIETFRHAPIDGEQPWQRFTKRIVLTGGIGIHLASGADALPKWSMVDRMSRHLPNVDVTRSKLASATERESYFFR